MAIILKIQQCKKERKGRTGRYKKVSVKKCRTKVEKEQKIIELLAAGVSIKKIVKTFSVSKKLVRRIKYYPNERTPTAFNAYRIDAHLTICEPKWCPECGALVTIWPCLLCHPNSGYYSGNL